MRAIAIAKPRRAGGVEARRAAGSRAVARRSPRARARDRRQPRRPAAAHGRISRAARIRRRISRASRSPARSMRSAPASSASKSAIACSASSAAAATPSTSSAHERALARIPDGMSFEDAAAVPEAFITAHDAMVTQAGLRAGETLLVHAVGSGVGTAAVQLARAIGANVVGTARTADKLERAKALGLDVGDRAAERQVRRSRATARRGGACSSSSAARTSPRICVACRRAGGSCSSACWRAQAGGRSGRRARKRAPDPGHGAARAPARGEDRRDARVRGAGRAAARARRA